MPNLARHKAILDLVSRGGVDSQESLQKGLSKLGFSVGQATLSRDIKQLGLVKGAQGYLAAAQTRAAEEDLPSMMHLVRQFVVEVREAQNLLVVKTTIGSAQPVAAALDGTGWPEVIGSIAGDDTVLIVAADKKKAEVLARRIRAIS
jgi:transcriptional regulator of arginine metabolism